MSSVILHNGTEWTDAIARTKDGQHAVRARLNLNNLKADPKAASIRPTHAKLVVDNHQLGVLPITPTGQANTYMIAVDKDGIVIYVYFNGWFGKYGWFFRVRPSVTIVEEFDDDDFDDVDLDAEV